jgi:Tfp pilus assembly protein PilP
MKLTMGILFLGMVAGTAWGQNPDVITNTRDTLRAVQQKQAIESNAAVAATQGNSASAAVPANPSAHATAKPVSHKAAAAKPAGSKAAGNQVTVKLAPVPGKSQAIAKKAAPGHKKAPKQQISVENQKKPADAKAEAPKHVNLTGRRDPFLSPVVNRSMVGSGCSTGKRCLAIDQINLKGVVKSDNGMIAVVTNSLNKAYFLRENDPVFNGYVVRITGDSIIFKETVQDRLGKPFTREVTKKITTSAV